MVLFHDFRGCWAILGTRGSERRDWKDSRTGVPDGHVVGIVFPIVRHDCNELIFRTGEICCEAKVVSDRVDNVADGAVGDDSRDEGEKIR